MGEMVPAALRKSCHVFGVLNPNVPRVPGAESIAFADLDLVAESDAPLRTYDTGTPTREGAAIARSIASFVRDGDALQIGIGKAPDALFQLLRSHRSLRFFSGMLSDGLMDLARCGAIAPGHLPRCCAFVGSPALYEWLRENDTVEVRGCEGTHTLRALAGIDGLIAVNSALSVDLFGQCNLETAGGRVVSSVGGAPDFARAARHSAGGLSIIALPSTFGRPGQSRIVPRLEDGLVSLARHDVDVIVTEHGAADLRNASVEERAEAMIGIADPDHRDALLSAWRAGKKG
jgi:acyl-CoA hydrolase